MGLECLLLCRDQQAIRVLQPALEKLYIAVEVCRGARSGQEILASEKYDAVVIDCDDLKDGLEVLRELRKATSNKNSVVFAILNGTTTTKQAFEMGANFVLQKPIQPLNALRCFSAAFGQMTRERRRYFRVPLEMPAILSFKDHQLKATATNLSEGGMAVTFRGKLPRAGLSKVRFTLPGTHTTLEPNADLAWADGSGHAGIRFLEVPQNSREQLERWLSPRIDQPETVSRG
ncbi:MAG TPA: PilZ domain-containing protein [Terriglobales bacterium]|jgi:DNA-binding response OmpR family regulator|nr:PilZ domain-containing protein [Terriglobales bacterium]